MPSFPRTREARVSGRITRPSPDVRSGEGGDVSAWSGIGADRAQPLDSRLRADKGRFFEPVTRRAAHPHAVIPAQAGIQRAARRRRSQRLDSRLRADRGRFSEGVPRLAPPSHAVIPAYPGAPGHGAGPQSQRDRAAGVSRGPVGRGHGPCGLWLASGAIVLRHWIPAFAGIELAPSGRTPPIFSQIEIPHAQNLLHRRLQA